MKRFMAVAAGLVLIGTLCVPESALAKPPHPTLSVRSDDGTPSAADLLAKTRSCNQVSHGTFTNTQAGTQVPICGANGAFFWTSGMNVDCDGQRTDKCNENTDCCFQADTSFHQTDGAPLDAAALPYVVIPQSNDTWDYAANGIQGGDVVAVIHGGNVEYAVFGDTGPADIIGEASYATADRLGINPDPKNGGTADPVTYIVFPGSAPGTIESHDQAVSQGRAAAQQFVDNN